MRLVERQARMPRQGWLFLPLPETTPEVLAAKLAEVNVVVEAIKRSFDRPDTGNGARCWANILPTLRWHGGDKYYSFEKWGMFVGVERDGYIHT